MSFSCSIFDLVPYFIFMTKFSVLQTWLLLSYNIHMLQHLRCRKMEKNKENNRKWCEKDGVKNLNQGIVVYHQKKCCLALFLHL